MSEGSQQRVAAWCVYPADAEIIAIQVCSMRTEQAAQTAAINCKLCDRRVVDSFESKWRHIVKRHPEVLIQSVLPYVISPERARAVGAKVADWFKEKIQ